MKNLVLTALITSFIFNSLYAQSDSIAVVKAKWEKQKIASGLKLKTFRFEKNLFKSSQNLSILEVRQRRNLIFDIAYDTIKLITTSDLGKKAGAIAALNGTFFDMKNGGSVDYIRVAGKTIHQNRLGKDGERAIHQKSALVFNNGNMSIAQWNEKPDWENSIDANAIMVSGPLLIKNQVEEKLDTANSFNKTRHPRTAVAITKNKRVLLITIDGRSKNAEGLSLFELRKLLRWLNVKDAINLDGGGSSTLWINNYNTNGVVNFPSDNKKWDHEGQRKVANAIVLRKSREQ